MGSNQDIFLWQQFRQGDEGAFVEIYRQYVKEIYNYAYKFTHDRSLTQDAVQELFVDLWEARQRLGSTDSIRFYLYRSIRRKVHRKVETSHLKDAESLELAETIDRATPSAEETIVTEENFQQTVLLLRKQIEQLPSREYEALTLRYYDGFSYEEIAHVLEINDQSARNLVSRAIQKLRQKISYQTSFISLTGLLVILYSVLG